MPSTYLCLRDGNRKVDHPWTTQYGEIIPANELWDLLENYGNLKFPGDKISLGGLCDEILRAAEVAFVTIHPVKKESDLPKVKKKIAYNLFRKFVSGEEFSNQLKKRFRRPAYSANPADAKEVEQMIDAMLESLQEREIAPTVKKLQLPSVDNLPKVSDQLRRHMQVLAIRGQVNEVVEVRLFGQERPATSVKIKYDSAGRFFGHTKKEIKKEVTAQPVHPRVEQLYRYMEKALWLDRLGQIRVTEGRSERQKKTGTLLIHLAELIVERIGEKAVDIESLLELQGQDLQEFAYELGLLEDLNRGEGFDGLLRLMEDIQREQEVQAETRADMAALEAGIVDRKGWEEVELAVGEEVTPT